MPRETMGDLVAFLAVARERSFTRAAAQLGVSASALSHSIRKLEERVGVRLLTRTTRSVSPTEAGERLFRTIGPHFDEIHREVEGLSELRNKPAGTIRITSADHPAQTILWPALEKILLQYPDIHVEISVDDAGMLQASDLHCAWVASPVSRTPGEDGHVAGHGWTLRLQPGWSIVDGARTGDARLAR